MSVPSQDAKAFTMKMPMEAVAYISLQRLETQRLGNAIDYTFLGRLIYPLYERLPFAKKAFQFYSTHIESRLWPRIIIDSYVALMHEEFDTLKNYIGNPRVLVGIGPGVAGLEIILSSHLREQNEGTAPRIILIDKTEIEPVQYGFHQRAAVYNSRWCITATARMKRC